MSSGKRRGRLVITCVCNDGVGGGGSATGGVVDARCAFRPAVAGENVSGSVLVRLGTAWSPGPHLAAVHGRGHYN